jgi:AraC-like DNA-binding protein
MDAAPACARWDLRPADGPVWRDEICDRLLGADAPADVDPRLDARIGMSCLDPVVALDLDVRDGGLVLGRGRARIAGERRPEAFGLTLVTAGEAILADPSGDRTLRRGDLCLLHSGLPFEKRMARGYAETFLYLPRAAFAAAVGARVPDPEPAVAAPSGLAGLLADTLVAFARRRRELGPAEWPPLLRALAQLMSAVFLDREPGCAASPARRLQRDRALRHIDDHLADPALSPRAIAAALGMSVRYLHLLFEDAGASVRATILARRLDRCRDALAGAPRRSISEIAFAWGFNDAAHFSRVFKARFGSSPRDLRAAA